MTAEPDEITEAGAEAPQYYGAVIIEWPAPKQVDPDRPLAGWGCSILDAGTGKQITTVEKISIPAVTADATNFITADLTMFADEDGLPVLFPEPSPGKPGSVKIFLDADGKPRAGTFPFLVAEMRVRQ